jgi:hypothetical protein
VAVLHKRAIKCDFLREQTRVLITDTNIALCAIMSYRFAQSEKFMPAGLRASSLFTNAILVPADGVPLVSVEPVHPLSVSVSATSYVCIDLQVLSLISICRYAILAVGM